MATWDFSDDEVFCLLVSGVVGIVGFVQWVRGLSNVRTSGAIHAGMALVPVACAAGLLWVLQYWADPVAVAGHADYVFLFMLVGFAWMTLLGAGLTAMGVSLRDDVLERQNKAAAVLWAGWMIGGMTLYAGANVGSGPTIWTTIAPAMVGTVLLMAGISVLGASWGMVDAVAIDRDVATGMRNTGVMMGMGLVIGRAAAGDWWSWGSTFADLLKLSWPAGVLLAAGLWMNKKWRPTAQRPRGNVVKMGLLPGAAMVGMALAWIVWLGPAEIGKHVVTYEQYTGHS